MNRIEPDFEIRPALATDRLEVLDLLEACGLPTAGVERHLPESYAVAVARGRVIGVAGIEPYGRDGLLRSVAVSSDWRGRAVGARLVLDRLAWAETAGLTGVYLLTDDAAGYFARLGFASVARDTVPDQIRASEEFASICPESATVMARRPALPHT